MGPCLRAMLILLFSTVGSAAMSAHLEPPSWQVAVLSPCLIKGPAPLLWMLHGQVGTGPPSFHVPACLLHLLPQVSTQLWRCQPSCQQGPTHSPQGLCGARGPCHSPKHKEASAEQPSKESGDGGGHRGDVVPTEGTHGVHWYGGCHPRHAGTHNWGQEAGQTRVPLPRLLDHPWAIPARHLSPIMSPLL